MTRTEFKALQFPNLPYCEFGLRLRESQFLASWHYRNSSTKVQLNVFWHTYTDIISVSIYDSKIEHERNRNKTVYSDEKFNNEILEKLCREYLT